MNVKFYYLYYYRVTAVTAHIFPVRIPSIHPIYLSFMLCNRNKKNCSILIPYKNALCDINKGWSDQPKILP